MRLAEAVWSSEPSALATLCRQAGIGYVVGGLPAAGAVFGGEEPWGYLPLLRAKEAYAAEGFELVAIEARPPLNKAKRGLPGRDAEIESVCQLLENMGRLGIGVWCYEWMADFNWLRTCTSVAGRGGSLVTEFDYRKLRDAPPSPLGPISEAALWENLEYFLERIVPVAESAGVRLAMHPDDPPLSPVMGVARIMTSVEAFRRLLSIVPSAMNGLTLCQGNFALMDGNLPAIIEEFGKQGKVFFVHLRDIRGTRETFVETWHDEGQTDLVACLEAYRRVGFNGPLRPDHVPTVVGDSNDKPGYSMYGRLYAIGYIRGLWEAVCRSGGAMSDSI